MNAPRYCLLALLCVLLGGPASSQELLIKAGPALHASASAQEAETGGVSANMQVGARFWLTDLFKFQGTLGYTERLSTEAAVQFRPFGQDRKYEPYAFVGYGVLFGDDVRRTVVPAGIGVEYHTRSDLGVFFELAGRWQSERMASIGLNNLDFFVAPSIGISYAFNPASPAFYSRAERADWQPRPEEPAAPVAAAQPATERAATPTYPQSMKVQPIAVQQDAWARWGQPSDDVQDLGDKVRIPDGTYIMGLTDEDPLLLQTAGLKRVTISAFVIDKYEVSNAEYRAFMEANGGGGALMPDAAAWERAGSASTMQEYFNSSSYADYPVVAVTWQNAADYCSYVGGRLPTEAEWEYAARSGMAGAIYPWPGLEPRNPEGAYLANYNPGRGVYAADGFAFTAPVESFWPTPWGIHNMSGNVAEWVQDSYSASYNALSNFNPTYTDPGEPRRIVRGGSWASDDFYIGVGVRDAQPANEASIFTGFRCAYGLDAALGVAGGDDMSDSNPIAVDAEDGN